MAQTIQPTDPKAQMFVGGNQYVQAVAMTVAKREWSADLFNCCSDIPGCLCTMFFPWCYLYKIYSDAGEGCCDCFWGGLLPLRVKVRTERGIKGSICGDVFATAFCPCCSMIQVGNEIKSTNPLI